MLLRARGAIGQFLEFRVGTVTERRRVERVHEENEIRIHLTRAPLQLFSRVPTS